jgi:DNA excision repair protein ERCC-6
MEGIFARSGVHSALEHDEIINGKQKIKADPRILEQEAKKVAAEAAAALRKAEAAARSIQPGTVTWTGEFGSAGRPVNIRRGGGPSSAGILAGLADKQGRNSSSTTTSKTVSADGVVRVGGFMKLIRDYIRRQGGSVPTQNLVNHFNHLCPTPQQTAEFKHILGEIAVLERPGNSRMRGKWVLKEEFR